MSPLFSRGQTGRLCLVLVGLLLSAGGIGADQLGRPGQLADVETDQLRGRQADRARDQHHQRRQEEARPVTPGESEDPPDVDRGRCSAGGRFRRHGASRLESGAS